MGNNPFDVLFRSTVVNGVNFISLDDVYGTMTARQAELFEGEVKKGLPIVLCMHVPIYSDEIAIASYKYWMTGDWKTLSLRSQRLLRAILVGHEHFSMRDDLSPTA